MRGCCLLLDGDEDTPLPNASAKITKYLSGSTSLPGPISPARFSVVPVNHVGNNTALDFSALSFPNVR